MSATAASRGTDTAAGRAMRWRALLFVPVLQSRFVDKAHERGADAIVLDLEDSIPAADKDTARRALPGVVDALVARKLNVTVRVNRFWPDAFADIAAAVRPGVSAIVLPKVRDAGALRVACELVSAFEARAGITAGSIGLIPMIEDAQALAGAADIAAATPRNRAITLGAEDYAVSVGCGVEADAILFASSAIVQAAVLAGIVPLGLLGSIADFADPTVFRERVRRSRALGFRGSLLIHPKQVAAATEGFAPTDAELRWARTIVQSEGQVAAGGAVRIDGQMVDRPVLLRAQQLLADA